MNDYMALLHKHKINGGFLAPDRIPMEERNKNEMILELQNEVHTKDKEIERLNNIKKKAINELFNLKDMIYKPETREINFDIQNKISLIIKILGSEKSE